MFSGACSNLIAGPLREGVERGFESRNKNGPDLSGPFCMNPKLTASPLGAPRFYFFFLAGAFFFAFAAFLVAFFID
jgi:hypothetical protein